MSKSADYWRGRFSILADAAHRDTGSYISDLETMYRESITNTVNIKPSRQSQCCPQ